MTMTLDDVRKAELDLEDFRDSDIEVVNENWEDLTDEEKKAWASLKKTEEEEDDNVDDSGDGGDDDKSGEGGEKDEDGDGGDEEEPDDEGFHFKTKEELDEYLAKKIAETRKNDEEPEKETEEEDNLFADLKDWKPKDWGEFGKTITEKVATSIQRSSEAEKERLSSEIDKINQGFDEEIESIRSDNKNLPAKGTKEGTAFEKELSQIALDFQVPTMKAAYKLYKAVGGKAHVDKKVDKKDDNNEEEEEKPDSNQERKRLAKKVGGKSRASSSKKKEFSYDRYAGQGVQGGLSRALDRLENEDY